MATTAFIASELEFVPNNYSAPVANENAPEAFHLIQRFLLHSDIGTALTAPSKLSATQIRTFWQTGTYDNGGESGSPSIIFEFQGDEFVVTPTTVRDALGLEDFNAFTISVGDFELVRMMGEIGYTGPLTKIGQLKRPFLRKEWSFFFDCITRAFGKKCTNWDAIPTDSLQIGYSLLFGSHFDVARLVLTNIGEKMLENRNVVYFSRFCQLIFNFCCPNVEIVEDDVILSFKLHKRIFSDLINKDNKKGEVGPLLLPASVQQFLDNLQQQQVSTAEAGPSVSQPQRSKRSKVRAVKSGLQQTEAEASNVDAVPQRKRMKKRRAQRAKSVATDSNVDSETEADEETLHQRKRRLVADQLFGDIIANMDKEPEDTEAPTSENEEIVLTNVPSSTPAIVEEDILTAEDAANSEPILMDFEPEAPTSKADDVVEEAAAFSDSRIVDHDDTVLEADQATTELVEPIASHTEIISLDFEKGEEVDQIRVDPVPEAVAVHVDATDNDQEDIVLLEALQQSVVEIVQREAEVTAPANSDVPQTVADQVPDVTAQLIDEITAENVLEEDDNAEASPAHSNSDIQVEVSDIQANSTEEREVQRAASEHFQNMYYNAWANADCVFPAQRAADFLSDSVKKITNPDVLTSLQATVIQVKSLNNRFDENQQMLTKLRNEVSLRDITLKADRTSYYAMFKQQARDSEEIKKRLGTVEDNQHAMSAQLTSISTALELLTSVLLSDDVKKGESVSSDKCKDTQTLRRRDDGNDGGNKGGDGKSLRSNDDRRLLSRRSNSDKRSNSGKGHVNSASGSRYKSLIISDKPSTDEEIAAKMFMAEHGKDVTIEDIQAEEQMLAEEHKKNVEAGIYKKKEIKAPRKKEKGIVIKENVNSDQSLQYSRRPVIKNADKGKGKLVEEEQLPKKIYSTSDIAQVETRLAKSTSDAAQVDDPIEVKLASDKAQAVQTQLAPQLKGFLRPVLSETLTLQPVDFSQTRTVLGKESYDKSGLGSHREKRINNRSQDNISLAGSGIRDTQENLDKLESVQLIFHRVLKKQFLLYFMSDGSVYRVGESDVNLKSWEELEYVLYLLKVKNRHTHNVAQILREKMLRSKVMLGGGEVSNAYIPKYRNHAGQLVKMKKNSARFTTALGIKVLEFNLESDKAQYVRLGNDMKKNSIYSLRAAIYQTGEGDPEYKELKEIMIAELENAERRLLIDYLRTVPDIEEVK
ncbi:hypothetical protein POM88_025920 [Heracleum sosnowskyi]|uniref:Uncharacterized protein n=1 Tax=Heracleum sosnowskyi TaxID=360622 RepID=A0AAD8I4X8_9APIA|nr:hypothetical protein POM88_025920 [Heracleum sosnowskyi]